MSRRATDEGGAVVTALSKPEEALEAVESRAEVCPLVMPFIDFIEDLRAWGHLSGKFLQWAFWLALCFGLGKSVLRIGVSVRLETARRDQEGGLGQ